MAGQALAHSWGPSGCERGLPLLTCLELPLGSAGPSVLLRLPRLPCQCFSVAVHQNPGELVKNSAARLPHQWSPDIWDGTRDAFCVSLELPRSTEEQAASISPQGSEL